MSKLKWVNLALRAVMELGIVLGLGYWGYHIGESTSLKILLSIGAPVIVFGFWGWVDFRQAGRFSELLRLIQELVISGLVAVALYATGVHMLGWTLGGVSVVHHAMVYPLGETLLKEK